MQVLFAALCFVIYEFTLWPQSNESFKDSDLIICVAKDNDYNGCFIFLVLIYERIVYWDVDNDFQVETFHDSSDLKYSGQLWISEVLTLGPTLKLNAETTYNLIKKLKSVGLRLIHYSMLIKCGNDYISLERSCHTDRPF